MSDSPWQSPGGEPQRPAQPVPPVQPMPPAQPTYGQFAPPPPAWAPPPKPGLVPFRPLGLGDILGGSFRVLRRNPRPVIGVSMVIKLTLAIITIASIGLFTVLGIASAVDASDPAFRDIGFGDTVTTQAGSLVSFILGIVADAILQGIITLEVARGTLGEKLPLRALWRLARGRVLVLVGWGALLGLVLLVGLIAVIGSAVGIGVAGGVSAIPGAIGIAFLLAIGALVLSLWLGTKLSLVPSALLLERAKLGVAIRRSWELTRGFFWRTLGIELLVAVIVGVAASIILFPISLVFTFVILTTSTSVTGAPVVPHTTFTMTVISEIASAIVGAITAIISTSATALIYIDLRIRKEGLDLELLRFVEAKDAGAEATDPYAARPAAATREPWA